MDTNNTPQNAQDQASEQQTYVAGTRPEPNYIVISQASTRPSANSSVPKASRKRPGLIGLMLAAMLIMGMLFGGAGAGAIMLVAEHNSALATPTTKAADTSVGSSTGSAQLTAQDNQTTINSVYQKLSPSIVKINAVASSSGRFGGTSESVGTGIMIDTQGDMITNYHVIEGGTSIKVELSDGSQYDATVVGTAPQDDLALIKASIPSDKLVPVQLGDSSTLKVGDAVIAIGYPYALDQSVTSGIVSGLNRDASDSTTGRTLTGLIQTDAAINPGNSGGPLVNNEGQVIGINTMLESPVEGFTGVGMAIPSNLVKSLISQLEGGGTVQRTWLGISGVDISSGVQTAYNLPVSKGILVMDVTSGSPAANAGLQGSTSTAQNPFQQSQSQVSQIGDIIVAIDGNAVSSVGDLTGYLNTKQPGDQVSLTIIRDGQQQNMTATLQAWPASTTSTGN